MAQSGLQPGCLISGAQGPNYQDIQPPHSSRPERGDPRLPTDRDQTIQGTEGPCVKKGTERIKVKSGEEPPGEPDGSYLGCRQQGATAPCCPKTGRCPPSVLHAAPLADLHHCPHGACVRVHCLEWTSRCKSPGGGHFLPIKVTIHY